MKRISLLLVLLIAPYLGWSQAQPAATPPKATPVSPLAEYAGEWTGVFNGSVWLQLWLKLSGDQLGGSMVHARNISLNDNGELKTTSEEQSTENVVDAKLNPDGLVITVRDPDTQETDRYLMRLAPASKDTADLKMLAMEVPPGMAKPKPWRLTKKTNPTDSPD